MTAPSRKRKADESAELVDTFKAIAAETIANRRSTRARKVPQKALDDLVYIVEPVYVAAADDRAGGMHSSAVLGPGAYHSRNSDSVATLPEAIVPARKAYPDRTFVAGHLLNAEFGGDGADPENLTILSSAGNSAHKNYDNRVKDAIGQLMKAYQEMNQLTIDVLGLRYGIRVDIAVDDSWWDDDYPGSCISTGLTCTAAPVAEPDPEALLLAKHPDQDRWDGNWPGVLQRAQAAIAEVRRLTGEATAAGVIVNN